MSPFSFGKIRNKESDAPTPSFRSTTLSDLKSNVGTAELLIFILDDNPSFMQILNTHFSKLQLDDEHERTYTFKVRNYATGRSGINDLPLKPDVILLNYYINKGLPNAMTGKQTLDEIIDINPNQKVMILNDLNADLQGAFVENGLRDFIISDPQALEELNKAILEVLTLN